MIKSKIIRKIFITTVTMFILLTVFSIPIVETEDVLNVDVEISDNNISSNNIYLVNDNGYLVRGKILLDKDNIKEDVLKILSNLIISDTSKYGKGLNGTIPKGTKVREVFCGNELITVDFSKEILNVSLEDEKNMFSSIVYSILDIEGIKGVSILVEGEKLEYYPNSKEKLNNILTKDIGINKEYDIKSRENISSVVVYYLEEIEDDLYYVPVTKYLNDERDKIKIIVEELTTSYIYEENLMSFLNNKVELIDYREENDIFFLNFNEYLYDSEDRVLEEVIYSLAYSVFDNYNVNMVMFEVNGEEVGYFSRN